MTKHKTVLLHETIDWLNPKDGGVYVDATLGGGGHALSLLSRLTDLTLVVIDVDDFALDNFSKLLIANGFKQDSDQLVNAEQRVILCRSNFRSIGEILHKKKISDVDGIYADLGFSSDQLEGYGMSFLNEEKLDMRLDKDLKVTAKDLVNGLYVKELDNLFSKLGDVRFSKQLAKAIAQQRAKSLIETTSDLRKIVQKIVPFHKRIGTNKHPEAKVFQALRIAVNDELGALREFLPQGFEALRQGGVLAVISFHSGEDRIVKNFCYQKAEAGEAEFIQKLIKPSQKEIESNPRSRSAKLRIISKLPKHAKN